MKNAKRFFKEDYVKYFDDRMKEIANNLGKNFRKWEDIN